MTITQNQIDRLTARIGRFGDRLAFAALAVAALCTAWLIYAYIALEMSL